MPTNNDEIKKKLGFSAELTQKEDMLMNEARSDATKQERQRIIKLIKKRANWLEQMKTGETWNREELQHKIDCCDVLITKLSEKVD